VGREGESLEKGANRVKRRPEATKTTSSPIETCEQDPLLRRHRRYKFSGPMRVQFLRRYHLWTSSCHRRRTTLLRYSGHVVCSFVVPTCHRDVDSELSDDASCPIQLRSNLQSARTSRSPPRRNPSELSISVNCS